MISDIDITEVKINLHWDEIEAFEVGIILEWVGQPILHLSLQQLTH